MALNGPDGRFTQGELRFATWWVRNHLLLRQIGLGTLIALAVAMWGYALWGLVDAYAISYPRESRFTRDIALNQQRLSSLEADRPQDVSIADVSVLQTTAGRYDIAVEVTNPNDQWWAEFTYSFNLSGEQTPARRGYVLPRATQILTELGYTPKTAGGGSASLIVDNVRWHRLDPAFIGSSYPEFAQKRFELVFENVNHDTNLMIGNKAVGQTSFIIVNKSGYGFWSVDLILRLFRGPSVIGITKLTVEKISPGERRSMSVVWPDSILGVTKTDITPQVNLVDRSVYLPTQYF